MQPTVKFRLLKSHGFIKGDPFLTDSYGNYYRVQQWWVKSNTYTGSTEFLESIGEGEWRDIDIEIEE